DDLSAPLEILNGPLVLLGRLARRERAEVAPFAGLRIDLARVETVLAGFQFSDHASPLPSTAAQTLSASTVSRTSCTRTIAAPRATAASAAARLPARRSFAGRPVSVPSDDLRD